MIQINIYKQSNYPISAVKIKKFLTKFFKDHGIVSDAKATVSFVNEKEMQRLGKKYYKKNSDLHSVFSFVDSESIKFPNEKINLGEIVVCFPIVVKEAGRENKLIEEKVLELIEHSALHLLGIHHKEQ